MHRINPFPFLTLHADDVSRLEEVRHVISRVGVYAPVAHLDGVCPGQTNPPPLSLVLELVYGAEIEASPDDALCRERLRSRPGRQDENKHSVISTVASGQLIHSMHIPARDIVWRAFDG